MINAGFVLRLISGWKEKRTSLVGMFSIIRRHASVAREVAHTWKALSDTYPLTIKGHLESYVGNC